MSADIGLLLLLREPLLILGFTALLIALKLPLLWVVGRLIGGLDRRSALRLGVVLAAGGEFAFVVFKMAHEHGLFEARLHDQLVLVITLSMALTPLLVLGLMRLSKPQVVAQVVPEEYQNIDSDAPRVVISGMGRMGQIITRVLRAQRVPFVALETAVETIEFSRSLGSMPIFYGDPLRPEILRAAKVDQAEFFIIATDDPQTNLQTAELVRRLYPHIKIIARARNRQHVHRLLDVGVVPIRETFHSSLEMSRQALICLGLSEEQAGARIRRFQRHDEAVLEAQHKVYNDLSAVVQTAREARTELETLFDTDVIEERGVK